jgi:hypothetical protein
MRHRRATNVGDRIRDHIRSNVYGLVAIFIALGGTAYAVDTVGSADVINDSLLSEDLKNDGVRSADIRDEALTGTDVLDESLTGADVLNDSINGGDVGPGTLNDRNMIGNGISAQSIAPGGVGASEIADDSIGSADVSSRFGGSLSAADLAFGSVASAEVLNNSLTGDDFLCCLAGTQIFNGSITADDLTTNSVGLDEMQFGSVGGAEAVDNSLTGADIGESTLAPSIDVTRIATSDATGGEIHFGSKNPSSPSTIVTKVIPAGSYLVFAELMVGTNENTGVECSIWTDGTKREESFEALRDVGSDHADHIPLTATFTTTSSSTLALRCYHINPNTDVDTYAHSADLVAIPVDSLN